MSEMIERVARALHNEMSDPNKLGGAWSSCTDAQRERWRVSAHIIVAVMREPTESMVDAGMEHVGDPCWRENVKMAWRAMIGEAQASKNAMLRPVQIAEERLRIERQRPSPRPVETVRRGPKFPVPPGGFRMMRGMG